MRILIANDDGIYSPGLRALANIARSFGEVCVVAPDVERSASGHSITSHHPLTIKHTRLGEFEGYRVDGTPADCVALGLHQWDDVEVVLSGINMGPNLGNSLWHSGTLAAAKQATLFGKRGIAFSTPADDEEPDWDRLAPFVSEALEAILPDPELCLVNVNLPPHPEGLCWTRQSVRHYDGKVVPSKDPMGRERFWFTVVPLADPDAGSDRWAMDNNLVSMTPLRLDITDETLLQRALMQDPV
jgi:5'-nucleotidase